jgi:prepilin-type N-terminal cleavage/methylation domain-containing protein
MTPSRRALRTARWRAQGGFTLIELAIVVTIVGVLSVIAVVGYRRYMLHSKISEAQGMISAIRIAQEDYRSERGVYANIGPNMCPTGAGTATHKVMWDTSCSGGGEKWKVLPVHADGPVQFSYATTASAPGTTSLTVDNVPPANFVDFSGARQNPWYVVVATCDLDGSGAPNSTLVGASFANTIWSQHEGN